MASATVTTDTRTADLPLLDRTPRPVAREPQSYAQALKSTALIGGASLANVVFGMVRTKAMAVLLGPAGMGLMGMYHSIADLTQSLAGLGIPSSGVRQIAEASASEDRARIARTAAVLRRVSFLLAALGALGLIAFARPISVVSFGTAEQAAGVGLLAVAIFLRLIAAGQSALIQGMRRIADLARINVLAGLWGTAATIVLVLIFRERGIVPSLVAVAAVTLLLSWSYSRKVDVERASATLGAIRADAPAMLRLGLAFMASGFLGMGAAYAIRLIVLRTYGLEAAGLYQSAWTLGGLYVAFILQAMGSDFYPRLTRVAADNVECNRLVNEQAHISLLLAGPGVMATITLAPAVVAAFYSSEFQPAVSILRWVCLGMTLRVIAWPMGFIVLAKGAQKIFFWTEVAAAVVHVVLAWLLVPVVGPDGAGAAFFGLYVWHGLLIWVVVRRLSGFHWSAANGRLAAVFLPTVGALFVGCYLLPAWAAVSLGLAVSAVSTLYSLRTLIALVGTDSVSGTLQSLLSRLGRRRGGGSA